MRPGSKQIKKNFCNLSNAGTHLYIRIEMFYGTQPLCGTPQQETCAKPGKSLQSFKEGISEDSTLALYNPQNELKISADASSYGLGTVLLQKKGSEWQPVAFASCSMTKTKCHYAQIEKEALATTWACEKFSPYILGKPLQSRLITKLLSPPWNKTPGQPTTSSFMILYETPMIHLFHSTSYYTLQTPCPDHLSQYPVIPPSKNWQN